MEHTGIIARDYESIKARAQEMGVSFQWALGQRRQYLTDRIQEQEGIAAQAIRGLANSGELKHRLIMNRIARTEKKIRHACFDLGRLKPDAQRNRKGVDDTEIERARGYLIQGLLPDQVKHGMTLCPFHEDHDPSMSIKNNRAHCFSCNKTWDTISLVMEFKGYGFVEAVRYLNSVF